MKGCIPLSQGLVQERHPRLNSRILGDLDNLRFETGAKKIPLRVVDRQHSEQLQETLTEELNTKIESYEVLLRAVLVKEQNENSASHLIITIHHAITDGLSSIQLFIFRNLDLLPKNCLWGTSLSSAQLRSASPCR